MPQDPAIIQQQIENTRAELAGTIDAIAEIVSPKRVAGRATAQVKAKVDGLRERVRPGDQGARSLPAGAGAGAGPRSTALTAGPPTGARAAAHLRRVVRWDRVGLAAGLLFVLAVTAIRRHNSSD